jgi:hypothetical protein
VPPQEASRPASSTTPSSPLVSPAHRPSHSWRVEWCSLGAGKPFALRIVPSAAAATSRTSLAMEAEKAAASREKPKVSAKALKLLGATEEEVRTGRDESRSERAEAAEETSSPLSDARETCLSSSTAGPNSSSSPDNNRALTSPLTSPQQRTLTLKSAVIATRGTLGWARRARQRSAGFSRRVLEQGEQRSSGEAPSGVARTRDATDALMSALLRSPKERLEPDIGVLSTWLQQSVLQLGVAPSVRRLLNGSPENIACVARLLELHARWSFVPSGTVIATQGDVATEWLIGERLQAAGCRLHARTHARTHARCIPTHALSRAPPPPL